MPVPLMQRWRALCTQLGLREAGALGEELLARYLEPHRRFHGPAHLAQVLDLLGELDADPRMLLAAWFHDAIYQPGRRDNELRSAHLARSRLSAAGLPTADIETVMRAVLATAGHAADDPAFAPLLDADLAVLGAPADDYLRYRDQIRREFAQFPEPLFRAARSGFLRGMLERPAIYRTPLCQGRHEVQARRNLEGELLELARGA